MKSALPPVCRDANAKTHIVVTVGHKWVTCVMFGVPIRLVQLPVDDHGLVELLYEGQPYPLKRAVRLFKQYGRESHGMTGGAKEALIEVSQRKEAA